MGRGLYTISIASRILLVFSILTLAYLQHTRGACAEARPATESSGLDLSGAPVDPLKAAAGKVVVLIFVRIDCPISNRYSPTIQRLSAEHPGRVGFWLVYPDRSESAEQIQKHQRDFGYTLPALRDVQRSLVTESRVQTTPEAAVFDANRKLVYHGRIDNLFEDFGRARPAATTHELEDAIQAALGGKALAADSVPAVGCYISDLK
jgi:hypothetical protein